MASGGQAAADDEERDVVFDVFRRADVGDHGFVDGADDQLRICAVHGAEGEVRAEVRRDRMARLMSCHSDSWNYAGFLGRFTPEISPAFGVGLSATAFK